MRLSGFHRAILSYPFNAVHTNHSTYSRPVKLLTEASFMIGSPGRARRHVVCGPWTAVSLVKRIMEA